MSHDDLQVAEPEYERIAAEIASRESPVGIDAEKTHVLIIHKLLEIEARLTRIERELRLGDKYNV